MNKNGQTRHSECALTVYPRVVRGICRVLGATATPFQMSRCQLFRHLADRVRVVDEASFHESDNVRIVDLLLSKAVEALLSLNESHKAKTSQSWCISVPAEDSAPKL